MTDTTVIDIAEAPAEVVVVHITEALDAYQLAHQADPTIGSREQWLASLQGGGLTVTIRSSTTTAIDPSTTEAVAVTLDTDWAYAITTTSLTSGQLYAWLIHSTQDATGSRTITHPASVRWAPSGSAAPTLNSGAGDVEAWMQYTLDAGVTVWSARLA